MTASEMWPNSVRPYAYFDDLVNVATMYSKSIFCIAQDAYTAATASIPLSSRDTEVISTITSHPFSPPPSLESHNASNQTISIVAYERNEEFPWHEKFKMYLSRLLIPPEPYYETMTRYITVEAQEPDHTSRQGVAMIDVHCLDNLISRKFAECLGMKLNSMSGSPVMMTLTGQSVQCLHKVKLRWHLNQSNIPVDSRFGLDHRYQEGLFLVTDAIDRFDVIIGTRTIETLRLFDQNRTLAAPGFRSNPPEIGGNAEQEEAKAKARREKDLEDMEKHQEAKDKKP